jgi:peptide/nickel transport system ATP-binding protein
MTESYVLEIDNLTVHYELADGVIHAASGMDIKLRDSKTLGLVGETGAGKTTTALSVLRLVPNPPGVIKGGSIKLLGEDIFSCSMARMKEIRGSLVSMIFQDPMTSLDPVIPVGEQIAEVFLVHEKTNKLRSRERAAEMLEMVGIPRSRAGEYPHQFSGGMKQRVGIAMALACNPKLLIADEPTTALDVTIQAQVLALMKKLKETYQTSMLLITHDLGIVADICDEVSVMYAGKIVEHGSLEDVFDNTKHPYTQGLFKSIPNIKKRATKLTPIPGGMPDPTHLPEGCPFHPRCVIAGPACALEAPELVWLSDTHYARCHRCQPGGRR